MGKHVAVIGLGYVGLPLSMAIASAGYQVLGIDKNPQWVATIQQGISNIGDVSSEVLKKAVADKRFEAFIDYKVIMQAEQVIICVPTPLNAAKEPDLSYIISAVDGLIPYIQKGTLISLESTTYPGTTDELIVERIQREKGWQVGQDFYACYSPERVDPGNKQYKVESTPKVVGGTTAECLKRGKAFYESFLPQVVTVSSTRAAEMTKLLENSFRCINIAFINEMTMMCERMNIDIWEVIKGASSKPFGFMPFYPGAGVGGHCIPLDPLYLSWEAKKYDYFNRFIELASDINNNMPYYVVRQIREILNSRSKVLKDSKLLLVGMSYKKDISDTRESPSLEVLRLLLEQGGCVSFYDPYVETVRLGEQVLQCVSLDQETVSGADLVILLTDHEKLPYGDLIQWAQCLYDTKNRYDDQAVIKLGQKI